MTVESKLTPMMQQYMEVKRNLPANTLLLFRLGDFYEMFNEDAELGCKLIGLRLKWRQETPMCGLPYHAADNYVGKLLAAGKKVAICDQQEAAKPGKLVKRSLTRILSPGTTLASGQLDAARNHYLCALSLDKSGLHAAWLDLSTGEFKVATDARPENLLPVLTALDPAEIVMAEETVNVWKNAPHDQTAVHALHFFASSRLVSELPGYHCEVSGGAKAVMNALGVLNLQGFGLAHDHVALGAAGALVHYATENLCAKPENLPALQEYRSSQSLLLDPATLRNLEIFQSTRGSREGSLLSSMNRTVTATGARLLERWLAAPPLDLVEIQRRQGLVGELLGQPVKLHDLHDLLAGVRDIPRILGRLQNRLRNPRELGGVRDTLPQLPQIIGLLGSLGGQLPAPSTPPSGFVG